MPIRRRRSNMPADKKVQDASRAAKTHIDELLDEALEETFPASDSVAIDIEASDNLKRTNEDKTKPVV
jgi:hypothetical protein